MPSDPSLRITQSGLEAIEAKMQALANNLANVRTPGYHASDILLQSYPLSFDKSIQQALTPGEGEGALLGRTGSDGGEEVKILGSVFDEGAGNIVPTHVPTDLAIEGSGYFVVQAPWGTGYTRDGRFYFDTEGLLRSVAGNYLVMGTNGPIAVTPGSEFGFSGQGEVIVNGEPINQLLIIDFQDPLALQTVSGSLFRETGGGGGSPARFGRVLSGFVETSNTNLVNSMMEMIALQRMFDHGARAMRIRNDTLDQLMQIAQPVQ